ncbi:MAG: RluA family pseudouridine synthase [Anaerolineales bacterium]
MDTSENDTLPLVYEDDDLLVINKPSGLLSIQDGYHPEYPHLTRILEPQFGEIWLVHRLDKDTSGLILLARNATTHRELNRAFRVREIKKIYHGLVTPIPEWREMDIQLPLLSNADRHHRTRVNVKHGKKAQSFCKITKWFDLGVLMEIQILTGITHQIRAHLRAFNLSLLGDILYSAGLGPQPFQVQRTMLHARQIAFTHPMKHTWLELTAPYPDDFRAAYEQLKTTTTRDVTI